jgi:hypothetical protein
VSSYLIYLDAFCGMINKKYTNAHIATITVVVDKITIKITTSIYSEK